MCNNVIQCVTLYRQNLGGQVRQQAIVFDCLKTCQRIQRLLVHFPERKTGLETISRYASTQSFILKKE